MKGRLSFKIISILVLVACIAVVPLTIVQTSFNRSALMNFYNNTIRHEVSLMGTLLAEHVYALNFELVANTAETLFNTEGIQAVTILNEEDSVIYTKLMPEEIPLKYRYTETADMIRGGESLGTLIIVYSGVQMEKMVAQQRFFAVMQNIVILAVILAMLTVMIELFVIRPLAGMPSFFSRVSNGDLSVRLPENSRDEIGELSRSFNVFLEGLNSTFQKFQGLSEQSLESGSILSDHFGQVSSAVEEIKVNIFSIKDNTDDLIGQIQAVNTAKDAINDASEKVSGSINEQSIVLTETSSVIEQTLELISELNEKNSTKHTLITDLTVRIENASERMDAFTGHIAEIARGTDDIIEMLAVINSIAEQTGMLSMNAAIEAAHAGQYGKGFAVVADEIGKLAENTARSTLDIGKNLKSTAESIRGVMTLSGETEAVLQDVFTTMRSFASETAQMLHDIKNLNDNSNKILTTHNNLVMLSMLVNDNALEMTDRTNDIESSMDVLVRISDENFQAIKELTVGVREISNDVNSILDLSNQNLEASARLKGELGNYKVEDVIVF